MGAQERQTAGSRQDHQVAGPPALSLCYNPQEYYSPMYLKQSIAPEVLEAAEKISLRDLLDSPAYQSWLLSALSNGSRFRFQFKDTDTHFDTWIQFQVDSVMAAIPSEQKQECFEIANTIIKNHKKEKMSYAKR